MLVYPVLFPNRSIVDIGFVNGTLPWRSLARFDQWNWQPLADLSESCHLLSPKIAYLGGGREFNPAAMEYPWAANADGRLAMSYPDAKWLWRYEDGAPDWQKIIGAAKQSDFIITAPNYVGEVRQHDDLDNEYNAKFAKELSRDHNLEKAFDFYVGRFEPVEIVIFRRRDASCESGQHAQLQ
jgi:hypothetical protein